MGLKTLVCGYFRALWAHKGMFIALSLALLACYGLSEIAKSVFAQRGPTMSVAEVLLWAAIMSAPFLVFLGWTVWAYGGLRRVKSTPEDEFRRRFPG